MGKFESIAMRFLAFFAFFVATLSVEGRDTQRALHVQHSNKTKAQAVIHLFTKSNGFLECGCVDRMSGNPCASLTSSGMCGPKRMDGGRCPCDGPGCGCNLPCGVQRKCPVGCIPDPGGCKQKHKSPKCCPPTEDEEEEALDGEPDVVDWYRKCYDVCHEKDAMKNCYYEPRCPNVAEKKPCQTGKDMFGCLGCGAFFGETLGKDKFLVESPFCRFCGHGDYQDITCPPKPSKTPPVAFDATDLAANMVKDGTVKAAATYDSSQGAGVTNA